MPESWNMLGGRFVLNGPGSNFQVAAFLRMGNSNLALAALYWTGRPDVCLCRVAAKGKTATRRVRQIVPTVLRGRAGPMKSKANPKTQTNKYKILELEPPVELSLLENFKVLQNLSKLPGGMPKRIPKRMAVDQN